MNNELEGNKSGIDRRTVLKNASAAIAATALHATQGNAAEALSEADITSLEVPPEFEIELQGIEEVAGPVAAHHERLKYLLVEELDRVQRGNTDEEWTFVNQKLTGYDSSKRQKLIQKISGKESARRMVWLLQQMEIAVKAE